MKCSGRIVDATGDVATAVAMGQRGQSTRFDIHHTETSGVGFVVVLANSMDTINGPIDSICKSRDSTACWVNPESDDVKDAYTASGTLRKA